jgi:hypothetical protein
MVVRFMVCQHTPRDLVSQDHVPIGAGPGEVRGVRSAIGGRSRELAALRHSNRGLTGLASFARLRGLAWIGWSLFPGLAPWATLCLAAFAALRHRDHRQQEVSQARLYRLSRGPAESATAEQMRVDVKHRLSRAFTTVDDEPVPVRVESLLPRNLGRPHHHVADHARVGRGEIIE